MGPPALGRTVPPRLPSASSGTRVSPGGSTGEGPGSKPTCLLAGLDFPRPGGTEGLRALCPCWLLAKGCHPVLVVWPLQYDSLFHLGMSAKKTL